MFIIMPDLLAILIYGPPFELNSRGLINAPHAQRSPFYCAVQINDQTVA